LKGEKVLEVGSKLVHHKVGGKKRSRSKQGGEIIGEVNSRKKGLCSVSKPRVLKRLKSRRGPPNLGREIKSEATEMQGALETPKGLFNNIQKKKKTHTKTQKKTRKKKRKKNRTNPNHKARKKKQHKKKKKKKKKKKPQKGDH